MDVFQAIQAQMQGIAASDEPPQADVEVSHLAFHPAGTYDLNALPTSMFVQHRGSISTWNAPQIYM